MPSDYDSADYDNAVMFAHRRNIGRYKKLLKTYLTEHERRYVEQRLSEEQAALRGKTKGVDGNAD